MQRGRGETRPDPTEPWEVGLLGRCFLSQEMMVMGMMRREVVTLSLLSLKPTVVSDLTNLVTPALGMGSQTPLQTTCQH